MALKNKPKCEKKEYQNCFANDNGRCLCLSDNNFRGEGCPFYKKQTDDFNMSVIGKECRLYAQGHGGKQ